MDDVDVNVNVNVNVNVKVGCARWDGIDCNCRGRVPQLLPLPLPSRLAPH